MGMVYVNSVTVGDVLVYSLVKRGVKREISNLVVLFNTRIKKVINLEAH